MAAGSDNSLVVLIEESLASDVDTVSPQIFVARLHLRGP